MLAFLMIVAGLILFAFLFITYYPVFGGKASREKSDTFNQYENFSEGKFVNQIPTIMDMKIGTTISVLKDFLRGNPKGKPDRSIPMVSLNTANLLDDHKQSKITWFGHSAFLLEVDGKRILIDPMFGNAPSPFPIFGSKRYSEKLPFEIDALPLIDAVIYSHDHYDHLDFSTIKKLKDKVSQFIVPLGVGAHLERWGIDQEKISEHGWWSEFEWNGLTLVCTPARHFSGRSLTDRNSTLWCSWVITTEQLNIYFSGDSGYGPHFKEIGEKYGPFDLTLMECGQYDERWSAIHMVPEETVQAHLDVNGKTLVPIHWAAFTLALHDWTDPIERAWKEAKKKSVDISTPKIGETIVLDSDQYPRSAWWR
ncbi:MBL fold metallo-hydrolase [Brevibacillus sp. SYSU BS000544]|uniref:MBL fold metallo-hydrolase n=1 Tax=Brevibacillus sp. SYSU BS000544 TaxID=3416443 RepID=UPI003CE468F3